MWRSSVQLFSLLESSLPHKMLPKTPSLALSVPTLRCRCFALCFLMPCDVGVITRLQLPCGDQVCNCSRSWKVLASQNVAQDSQFGSVCAHSALPLLRTLFPDAK